MADTFKYRAFISYRHMQPDERIAKWIHSAIENYRIPSAIRKASGIKKMGRVFRDQEELPLTTDLGADIDQALKDSEWLIVICSPRLLQSRWCMKEIDTFIALDRRDHILTVLVEGTPEESFPPQVRFITENGLQKEIEPLAANLCPDAKGGAKRKLKVEKLRLFAPLLNVSFDDLRQRHRARVRRIAVSVTSAGFVLLAGFTAYVLRQNALIDAQRILAVRNEVSLLAEKSRRNVLEGDKTTALKYALDAANAQKTLQEDENIVFSALENAAYIADFEQITTLKNNNMRIEQAVYSPDDCLILGIVNKNMAAMFDAKDGALLYTVGAAKEPLSSVAFSPDGTTFMTVSSMQNIADVWDTETGEHSRHFGITNIDHMSALSNAFYLPDGGRVLVKMDVCICIWDLKTDKAETLLRYDDHNTLYIEGSMSADGRLVTPGSSHDGRTAVYETATGKEVFFYDGLHFTTSALSGGGRYLGGVCNGQAIVFRTDTGETVLSHEEEGGGDFFYTLRFSPDERLVAFAGSKSVYVYDIEGASCLYEFHQVDGSTVFDLSFSDNSHYLAFHNGKPRIVDLRTGQLIAEISHPGVTSVAFNHQSDRLLLVGIAGNASAYSTPLYATVKRVDAFDEALFTIPRYTAPAYPAAMQHSHVAYDTSMNLLYPARMYVDPTGRYAAAGYPAPDSYVEIWDLKQGEASVYGIQEHTHPAEDIVFFGDRLASTSLDKRIILFDMNKGMIERVLIADNTLVKSEWNIKGDKLIAKSYDGQDAYVFSAETGDLLMRMKAPLDAKITDVGFTMDDLSAVALLSDGGAVVGELFTDIDALIDHAQTVLSQESE